jgi:hypothetical protein
MLFSFFTRADNAGYKKEVKAGDFTFVVSVNAKKLFKISTYQGSGRRPVIKKKNFQDIITGCEAAVMIKGNTQLLVYTTTASGRFGNVIAYNFGPKICSVIKLLALAGADSAGYKGHDKFSVKDNSLVREFPVYNKGDADCCPKGGKRTVEYTLSLKNNPEFVEVK